MGSCGHNGATGWIHFEPYPHQSLDLCSRCYVTVTKKHDDVLRERDAELARLTAERDAAIARAERAERVAVWAARNGAVDGGPMDEDAPYSLEWNYQGSTTGTCHDGTDADLYRALVEACEGGDENG